ncbi:hypothetical protein [Gemmatimonas groenlandica]|uniref:DUF4390 domain-containing protein n=1 Tax=Gemmatimonas groenlandica TaxID=2732249 RepID=A0A6M4IM64_9BACT|nr:hypothetical protein [Gemmatimonas groenlandica]QJR36124.1 hypothetical protein HKW67_11715 [Gemmatimonas groenlandica]
MLLLLFGVSRVAWAQSRPEIDIRVAPTSYPPMVAIRGVLTEKPFDELLRSGFPARLHVRAEIWTIGRWFDDVIGRVEWDVVVRYDAIDRTYEVGRFVGGRLASLGSYVRFSDARAASELPYLPGLAAPPRGRKSYVAVQAELQTLDVSDLDELERWLRGEASPAVRGKRSPSTALTRGVRSLASRLLGGEVRRLEAKSPAVTY